MSLVFYQRLSGGTVVCCLQDVATGRCRWEDMDEDQFQERFGG